MIEGTISTLLGIQPFMGCLIQRCKIRWSEHVPTAGVRILPNATIEFIINSEFFYNLPDAEKVGLAWHEMLHLIMTHLDRGAGLNPKIANVAMDMDINQMIGPIYLPKGALLPSQFGFEKGKSFEVYYNLLKTHPDMDKYQQKKKYKGGLDGEKVKGKKASKEDIEKKIQEKLDQLKAQQEAQKRNKQNGQEDSKKVQKDLAKKQKEISERLNDMNMDKQAQDSQKIKEEQEKLADELKEDKDQKKEKKQSLKDQIRDLMNKLDSQIQIQAKDVSSASKLAQVKLLEKQKELTERLEKIGMNEESVKSANLLKTHEEIVKKIEVSGDVK